MNIYDCKPGWEARLAECQAARRLADQMHGLPLIGMDETCARWKTGEAPTPTKQKIPPAKAAETPPAAPAPRRDPAETPLCAVPMTRDGCQPRRWSGVIPLCTTRMTRDGCQPQGGGRPFVGPTARPQELASLDRCLSAAAQKQPVFRELDPVEGDLVNACQSQIVGAVAKLRSQGKLDSDAKSEIYAAHIVPAAWLVSAPDIGAIADSRR